MPRLAGLLEAEARVRGHRGRRDDGRYAMRCHRSRAARTNGSKGDDRSVRETSCHAARRSASCLRLPRPRHSAWPGRPRRCRRRARRRTVRCASAWRNWSDRPCPSRRARTGRTSCNRPAGPSLRFRLETEGVQRAPGLPIHKTAQMWGNPCAGVIDALESGCVPYTPMPQHLQGALPRVSR